MTFVLMYLCSCVCVCECVCVCVCVCVFVISSNCFQRKPHAHLKKQIVTKSMTDFPYQNTKKHRAPLAGTKLGDHVS
jgi:hypothetical protein